MASTDHDMHRDIGRLETKVEQLEKNQEQMIEDLKELKAILSEARGGWKALMLVAGISGTIGALLTKLSVWFAK